MSYNQHHHHTIIILLEWAWQDEPIVKLNQSAPPRYFPLSISIPPLTPGHLQITRITLELFFSLPWNFFISLSPFFQRSGLRSLEIFELIMFLCHRHFQPTCSNFATFRKDKIENNNYNLYIIGRFCLFDTKNDHFAQRSQIKYLRGSNFFF